MPVLDTLYTGALAERIRTQRWEQPCTTTLLVSLPPAGRRTTDQIATEVRGRLAGLATAIELDCGQFPIRRTPDRVEWPLLAGNHADSPTNLVRCAGGPIGLLDLHTAAQRAMTVAVTEHQRWSQVVDRTDQARGWWEFLDRHHHEPDRYPLSRALADFAAQPRITAMLDHDAHTGPAARFGADTYGPGLEAVQTGAATYGDYLAGVATYAGGLLTLDRELRVPSWTDVLVEQNLAERASYHQQAQTYLARLDPCTVLVAVRAHRPASHGAGT